MKAGLSSPWSIALCSFPCAFQETEWCQVNISLPLYSVSLLEGNVSQSTEPVAAWRSGKGLIWLEMCTSHDMHKGGLPDTLEYMDPRWIDWRSSLAGWARHKYTHSEGPDEKQVQNEGNTNKKPSRTCSKGQWVISKGQLVQWVSSWHILAPEAENDSPLKRYFLWCSLGWPALALHGMCPNFPSANLFLFLTAILDAILVPSTGHF